MGDKIKVSREYIEISLDIFNFLKIKLVVKPVSLSSCIVLLAVLL